MTRWIRFHYNGAIGFGTWDDNDLVREYAGDMFTAPDPTGRTFKRSDIKLAIPTEPTKMLALWNNFHALAQKLNLRHPDHPLYLIKTSNAFLASGEDIRRPRAYTGKIIYEGELGIVIGRRCASVSEREAESCIFGYTCINDVTAVDLINADASFPQWVRAKSFDTFGVFGPAVATGLRAEDLVVRTVLNGQERQNYPVSDMIFSPPRIVSLISEDMTLNPGDVICCGTSVGAGTMKEANNLVEVSIEGIGTLSNTLKQ